MKVTREKRPVKSMIFSSICKKTECLKSKHRVRQRRLLIDL